MLETFYKNHLIDGKPVCKRLDDGFMPMSDNGCVIMMNTMQSEINKLKKIIEAMNEEKNKAKY